MHIIFTHWFNKYLENLCVYVLGEHKPLYTFKDEAIAIIHRINYNDGKLVMWEK